MEHRLTHYRDLSQLSNDEWVSLDIYLFIAANFNRYCSALIKKIGTQYLPSDARESLLSLFCEVGHRPLASVHKKNMGAQGERRNQVMLGTLKMIAVTRMVEAVIREFPAYVTLNSDPDDHEASDFTENLSYTTTLANQATSTFYAASHSTPAWQITSESNETQEDKTSIMVEVLRSYLTPLQYKHIRYSICDGLSTAEIAKKTGHTTTNVRIMLLNARKTMLALLPQDLAADFKKQFT